MLLSLEEKGDSGICGRDLERAASIALPLEQALVPFQVCEGSTLHEYVTNLFRNWKHLEETFTRWIADRGQKIEDLLNETRSQRAFEVGDIVFRRIPGTASVLKSQILPSPRP